MLKAVRQPRSTTPAPTTTRPRRGDKSRRPGGDTVPGPVINRRTPGMTTQRPLGMTAPTVCQPAARWPWRAQASRSRTTEKNWNSTGGAYRAWTRQGRRKITRRLRSRLLLMPPANDAVVRTEPAPTPQRRGQPRSPAEGRAPVPLPLSRLWRCRQNRRTTGDHPNSVSNRSESAPLQVRASLPQRGPSRSAIGLQ